MVRSLIPVADHIWLYPADEDGTRVEPNIGIVATASGSVLIDAGNSPRHGRRVLHAMSLAGLPHVTHVIYTHHHWDHVFGAMIYDVPIIAHDACRDVLAERAARPWSYAYIEEEMRRNPATESMYTSMQRAMEEWHGFRIALPTVTFSEALTVHVDGATLELEHVGGQHAADSLIVRVPAAGVAFLGDCFYKPVPSVRPPDATIDHDLVRILLADERIQVFVDGHRPAPRTREDFARLADA